ncbi:hypothetical protein PENTCL1PPCAC_2393, partial [Pristionchus entomophagus]
MSLTSTEGKMREGRRSVPLLAQSRRPYNVMNSGRKRSLFLSDLEDTGHDKQYKKYFEKYLHEFALWAPFARVHAPFNTTMVSESFRSKLKMSILGDNTLSRVDRLVDVLINLPADLSEELKIAGQEKYVSGVFRLQSQMAAHKGGVSYGEDSAYCNTIRHEDMEDGISEEGW